MKEYIIAITFSDDISYIARKYQTKEEAIAAMNDEIKAQIEIVQKECGYTPSLLRWSDSFVTIVFAEGYSVDSLTACYALEHSNTYRVFEIED